MNKTLLPHQLLKEALQQKKRLNPACTLRWFARKTGKSHTYWSRVLNGQKPFSVSHFELVCQVLELDEGAQIKLRRAILTQSATATGSLPEQEVMSFLDRKFSPALSSYEDRAEKDFQIHSHWYWIAILDLTTCKHFVGTPEWISSELGITPTQAEEALKILVREGYLKIEEGHYRKTSHKLRFPTTKSRETIRRYHKQMIQKALYELEHKHDAESFERRLITGISIAANPANLDRAREILLAAIHEVAAVLSEGECTELYHLNTQLFSVLLRTSKKTSRVA